MLRYVHTRHGFRVFRLLNPKLAFIFHRALVFINLVLQQLSSL